jgi:hypothetical protein
MKQSSILSQIAAERKRQDAKWGIQNHPMLDSELTPEEAVAIAEEARARCQKAAADGTIAWSHILVEEVAETFAETEPARQREELIQVAAVALAMIECIDRKEGT